jgi:hypothetical protein
MINRIARGWMQAKLMLDLEQVQCSEFDVVIPLPAVVEAVIVTNQEDLVLDRNVKRLIREFRDLELEEILCRQHQKKPI